MKPEIAAVEKIVGPLLGCDEIECTDKRPGGNCQCAALARKIVRAVNRHKK